MTKDSPLFKDFCILLDKLSVSKPTEKKHLIQNYKKNWINNHGSNLFDFIRLLLPKGDERKYNLKEDRLAAILIKSLGIDPQSEDAIRLKHYKVPSNVNENAGVFSLNALRVIETRSVVMDSIQTIKETNKYLDLLSTSESNQVELFKEILNKYTPKQIEWMIRIILKDLRIHCGDGLILNSIHQDAFDRWSTHKSLKDISDLSYYSVQDGQKRLKYHIRLFDQCIPQTADPYSKNLLDKFSKPFYSELKLDGERIIMHFDRDQDKFLWHTRNRKDVSYLYGYSSKDKTKLSGHIHTGILSKRVILDGEMIGFDPETNSVLPFGTLNDVAKNKNINDPKLPHPSFQVFDILMIDDTPLIDNKLQDRLKVLDAIIKDQGFHLKKLERTSLETEEQVLQELEKRWQNQEEGLVLKDKDSTYQIGKRSSGWLKFKPSFVSSLVDTCDLLVVGARYGSGRRGGKLTSLLFAVRDDNIPDSPRFITFTLGANGLSDSLLKDLQDRMKSMIDYDPKNIPDWLVHPIKNGEPFHKVIGYQDSIVVEVGGAQIVESRKFGMHYTLRFPTCVRLRLDKGWEDVMTFSDVLKARAEGGVGKRRRLEDRIEKSRTKKSSRGSILLGSQKGLDPTNLEQKSLIFKGIVFYVINGTKSSVYDLREGVLKNDLERLIKENGGDFIQNKNADIIIAGLKNSTVSSIINIVKTKDIVLPSYILDCVEANELLPISPKYMHYTSLETQQNFLQEMDIYGDHYTKTITAKELEEIMSRMEEEEKDKEEFQRLLRETAYRYFNDHRPGMLFLNTVVYFDRDPNHQNKRRQEQFEIAKLQLESELGKVSTCLEDETITHLVFHPDDLSRLRSILERWSRPIKPRLVVLDWIHQSFYEQTYLNEEDYNPKYFSKQGPK